MRVIHTSDWHLGQYFYGKSRANEHQQFLSWLLTQVTEQKVDAIIVAGDIFDTATPPSYAREMYFNFIAELHVKDCQLVILAGNHDSVAMLSESQSLLASLSTRVITQAIPESLTDGVLDIKDLNQQVFSLNDEKGQSTAIVCGIPFIRPRDVIKSRAGQSASDKQQSLQQAISEHYQYLYQHALALATNIEAEQGIKVPIIATGHLTALGVSVSDSQSDAVRDIYIGSLEAFPATAFPPADYIALGHIHRAQKIAKTEHIRYCGSPIPLSFDEAKQDKRVLMVDFSEGKLSTVEALIIPCFQPLFMVKTSIDTLEQSLQETIELYDEYLNMAQTALPTTTVKAWLDIEIDNGEHLTDLTQRVSEITADMPFEILLVRRSKKARQRSQSYKDRQDTSTLSELSIAEVFDSRLSQLAWETDEEIARKNRITQLFSEISVELQVANNAREKNIFTTLSDANTDDNSDSNTERGTESKAESNTESSAKVSETRIRQKKITEAKIAQASDNVKTNVKANVKANIKASVKENGKKSSQESLKKKISDDTSETAK